MTTKILIVEDDIDILVTIKELLESQGYVAETAHNGMDALEVLKKTMTLPDLILLDYMMPEMDGATFRVEQERDSRIASIPILLMTADARPDEKQIQIGARGSIKKPFDIDMFLASIKKCLHVDVP